MTLRYAIAVNPAKLIFLKRPALAMQAEAYGGNGFVVNNVAELKKVARVALNSKRFTLIEARINPAEYHRQM